MWIKMTCQLGLILANMLILGQRSIPIPIKFTGSIEIIIIIIIITITIAITIAIIIIIIIIMFIKCSMISGLVFLLT